MSKSRLPLRGIMQVVPRQVSKCLADQSHQATVVITKVMGIARFLGADIAGEKSVKRATAREIIQ